MDGPLPDEATWAVESVDPVSVTLPAWGSVPRPRLRPTFLGQIPQFPDFKPLQVTDQRAVDSWARRFPPVSDFNFASLWSWNTDGSAKVSWLNDNLVVLFKDYLSSNRFLSFLGTNDVVATTMTLFDAARRLGIEPDLHLIPEATIATTPQITDWAEVALEPDQSDYVLSTAEWSTITGSKFRKKRNAIHHLEREFVPKFRPIDVQRPQSQREIQAVFGQWAVQSGSAGRDSTVLQALALQRLFSIERPEVFLAFGVYVDGTLRAFSINEPLHGGYALGHFSYADRAVPGLYPYLLRESCRALCPMGYRYLNIMQDLGQPGMRHAKTLSRPHHQLRKCVLTLLTSNSTSEATPQDHLIDVSAHLSANISLPEHRSRLGLHQNREPFGQKNDQRGATCTGRHLSDDKPPPST